MLGRTIVFRTTVVIIAILAAASIGCADIYEPFTGGATPGDWTIQGSDGSGMTDTGVAMGDNDFFGVGGTHSDGSYLRLTSTDQWERTSAFWTKDIHVSDNWTLTMDIRLGVTHDGSEITGGSDGLAFNWIDASTVGSNADLLGGYGEWLGTTRGDFNNGDLGYVSGIEGYSFQFDHWNNIPPGEFSQEFTDLIDINDWSTLSGSAHSFVNDTNFFYNDGWQTVRLDNNNGNFTFYWDYNGATFNSNYTWSVANMPTFDAYFGVTGSTGERRAFHEIRNFDLDAVLAPEPGTMALLLMGLSAGGAWIRRRRKDDA